MKTKLRASLRPTPDKKPFYNLQAQAGGRATLFLYGEIFTWSNSAREVIAALEPYRAQPIDVHINSVGGNVWEGTTIANFLKGLDAHAIIDGLCASIATRIAFACKTVSMPASAFLVIHNVWDVVIGNQNDLRKAAGDMEKVDKTLRAEYMAKTGDDEATIQEEMDAETWIDGAEAVERGFADTLIADIAPETVQASLAQLSDLDFSRFAKLPSAIRGALAPPQPTQKPKQPAPPAPPNTMEKLLAAIVAAGLIPSAKLDDDTAASLFKAEFDKLKKRADDAEKEKTDLQAKLDQAAAEAANKAAEAAVDEAVKAGKITNDPDLRGRWIAAFLKDEEGTKAMLKGMTATPAKPARGAPPVTDAPDDGLDDLDSIRAALAKETDPAKKYALGLQARKLRGHEDAFCAPK